MSEAPERISNNDRMTVIIDATARSEYVRADLYDSLVAALKDPATVWASMLRGTIARPQALDHYEELKAKFEAIQSWKESVHAAVPSNDRIMVINNNQPGWTNIVETAPNVTLEVGAMLVRGAIAFKIASDLLEAEQKVDDLRWLVINGERYFGTLWREADAEDIGTTRAAIAAQGFTQTDAREAP